MSQAKDTKLGPREEDVEELVQEILRDPSINISVLPDSLETAIYKSTIQLTLNAIYGVIQDVLDGRTFLEHEIRLKIHRQSEEECMERALEETTTACWNNNGLPFCCDKSATKAKRPVFMSSSPSSDINDTVLEEAASRLLENKAVNQRLLPDPIEHAIYSNCLKVIFRILDILTNSLRVSICGHDLRLNLEPSAWQVLRQASNHNNSKGGKNGKNSFHVSDMDEQHLRDLLSQADPISQQQLGFWDSLWFPRDFVVHLHESLYGLLLGILDDMLEHTKIEILSDQIYFDVAPQRPQQEEANQNETNQVGKKIGTSKTTTSTSHTLQNQGDPPNDAKAVCKNMESMGFEHERNIIRNRFQAMTPEQRAILLQDLHNLEG